MANTCFICGGEKFVPVYRGPIRAGRFGSKTPSDETVVKCESCGTVRLENFNSDRSYYESDQYRMEYNGTVEIDDYIRVHDCEQSPRIDRIGLETFRDKVVVDYGCGGGSFLDGVKGVASQTVGIEPYSSYHDSLKQRGHTVYGSSESALEDLSASVDVIVSFGVIEHVEDPSHYLKSAYSLLKPGGHIYIETDNLLDITNQIGFQEYKEFFFRTAHLYYFDAESLRGSMQRAGLEEVNIGFRHNYDLSNLLVWLNEKRPSGNGFLDFFDDALNAFWKSTLEKQGMADLILAKAVKK